MWVVHAKKGVTDPTRLTYEESVPEALCFGWIDNKSMRRDATTYVIRFTPRRPRGNWSASNIQLAQRLIDSGRMQPAGLMEVDRARADGRWEGHR